MCAPPANTRRTALRMLAGGMTELEIVSEYPDLKTEDIRECLRFAAASAMEREIAVSRHGGLRVRKLPFSA